jgi:hypothetical protein
MQATCALGCVRTRVETLADGVDRYEQKVVIISKDLLRAVACVETVACAIRHIATGQSQDSFPLSSDRQRTRMNVKVDDGDSLYVVLEEGILGADGDVVEETEALGLNVSSASTSAAMVPYIGT